jgi:uncharacterized protein
MKFEGFDWDDGNRQKCQKHGVSIEDIEELLTKPKAVLPDSKHTDVEKRWLAIGIPKNGRWMLVAFTFRYQKNRLLIRAFSARHMHRKEVEFYEETTQNNT